VQLPDKLRPKTRDLPQVGYETSVRSFARDNPSGELLDIDPNRTTNLEIQNCKLQEDGWSKFVKKLKTCQKATQISTTSRVTRVTERTSHLENFLSNKIFATRNTKFRHAKSVRKEDDLHEIFSSTDVTTVEHVTE
jgi:hypothetical protein